MAGVIVEDHVNDFAGRDLGLDRVSKANELLMPVALHAAADEVAVEHVESGEQRGRAVTLVVMGSWFHAGRPSAAILASYGRAPGSAISRRR